MNASNEEEMNRDVWGIAESRHFMRLTPEQRAVVDEIMSELPWHVKDMRAYVRRKGYHINGADKMHKVLLAMQIVMEELKQRGLMPAESVNASDER